VKAGGPASPTTFSPADLRFMRQALALAERGRGSTYPNPIVGAVITRRGRVLATGFHQRAGGPHGEAAALLALEGRAPGATLYVTLEPCCHTGRTGPCTEAILAAGISRVVVGCLDENPRVAGKGIRRLRRAGITVDVGCLQEEARAQNRGFFRSITAGRPHVTLKAAASLDGFLAPLGKRPPGTIHWLTGPPARAAAHLLRARHDAILAGAGTIRSDDPRLTVRLGKAKRKGSVPPPILRVVLDGRLTTPPTARLFGQRGERRPLVLAAQPEALPASERAGFERRRRKLAALADVVLLPAQGDHPGRIAAPVVLKALAERQVQSVLLEGGSELHATFVRAGLVDEVALFLAPQLLGGGVPIVAPWGSGADPLRFGPLRAVQLAGDILVLADVASPSGARQAR
jgi:diaminohydroxyphosphoribosylaminopyrimidine deaminase/5-amino-6-(5-phosphoribosylamino)uracil reductase